MHHLRLQPLVQVRDPESSQCQINLSSETHTYTTGSEVVHEGAERKAVEKKFRHPLAMPSTMFIRMSQVSGLTAPTSPCSHCSRLPLSTYSYTSILRSQATAKQITTRSNAVMQRSSMRGGFCFCTAGRPRRSSPVAGPDSCAGRGRWPPPPP